MYKQLIGGISGLVSANATAQFIQLTIFVFLARTLGPQEFGWLVMALLISNLGTVIIDFGSSTYFTRELAFDRVSIELFSSSLILRVLIFGSALLVGSLFLYSWDYQAGAGICLVILTQYTFQAIQAVPKSRNKTGWLGLGIIADRVVCLVVILAFQSVQPVTVWNALSSWSIGQICGIAIIVAMHYKNQVSLKIRNLDSAFNFRAFRHLGFFSLANIATTFDQIILGWVGGTQQTGLYGAVAKWFTPLGLLSSSISTISSNYAAKHSDSPWEAIKRQKFLWISMVTLAVIVALSGPWLVFSVDFLLGAAYENSKNLIPFLAITAALTFLNLPFGALLQYFGNEKFVSKVVTITGLVYLPLVLLVLSAWPINAALNMTYLQIALQATINLAFVSKFFTRREKSGV